MSCLHQKYPFPVLPRRCFLQKCSTGVTPSFGAAGAAQKEVKPLGGAALLTLDVVETN